jgi:hypothetical protein
MTSGFRRVVYAGVLAGAVAALGVGDGLAARSDAAGAAVSNMAPAILCPPDVTSEAISAAGAFVFTPGATASDPGDPSPVVTYSHDFGALFPLGDTTVTATATNAVNESASCDFMVTVQDTTPPRIGPIQLDLSTGDLAGQGYVTDGDSTFGIDSPLRRLVIVDASGARRFFVKSYPTLPIGAVSVDVMLSIDVANLTLDGIDTGVHAVLIEGNALNHGVTGREIRVAAIDRGGGQPRFAMQTSSGGYSAGVLCNWFGETQFRIRRNAMGDATLEGCGQSETIPHALLAASSRNDASFEFGATLNDATATVRFGPIGHPIVEATSAAGAIVTFAGPTDAVDPAPTTGCAPVSGSLFPIGVTTVTCSSTDAAGNSGTDTFTVTVWDRTGPVLSDPSDITANAASLAGAVVTYALPVATDAVDPSPSVICSPASGSSFPVGSTLVTCNATDATGNHAETQFFTVTVNLTVPLAITCPAPVASEAISAAGGFVTYPAATAISMGDPTPTIAYSQNSGTLFPLGDTTVTATATDDAGNSATCSFVVTVQDTTPPRIGPIQLDLSTGDLAGQGYTSDGSEPFSVDTVNRRLTIADNSTTGLRFFRKNYASLPIGALSVDVTLSIDGGSVTLQGEDTGIHVLLAEGRGSNNYGVTGREIRAAAIVRGGQRRLALLTSAGAYSGGIPCNWGAELQFRIRRNAVGDATLEGCGESETLVHDDLAASSRADAAFGLGAASANATAVATFGPIGHLDVEATSAAGAVVTFDGPTDAVDPAPITSCVPASGSLFPIGDTIVTCASLDAAGNSGTDTFMVTVRGVAPPAAPKQFFLHGSGSTANPPTLFLDESSPAGSTAKHRDSAGINFNGGNSWKDIGVWNVTPSSLAQGALTNLGNLRVWLGLKNSDDQGTWFDLRAEVRKNGDVVGSGLTRCITGVTRNANQARQTDVDLTMLPPMAGFNGSSDVMSIKLSTRIGTNADDTKCGGHNNAGGLRLYFDAVSRAAKFDATFETGP